MRRGTLFQGITDEEYRRMMLCFQSVERTFQVGTNICTYGDQLERIGVLLEGEATLMRTQSDGRQTILEYLKAGDIFGEALSVYSNKLDMIQLKSVKHSLVQFIDYGHLTKRCENVCPYHSQLISNAFGMISQKAKQLSERLEVLSQRSTREKLICYFRLMSTGQQEKGFEMSFSFSNLADYLSVDRSAMMREIKKLKEEGVISVDKRIVTLS